MICNGMYSAVSKPGLDGLIAIVYRPRLVAVLTKCIVCSSALWHICMH